MPTIVWSLLAAAAALGAQFAFLRFFDWLRARGKHHFYQAKGPMALIHRDPVACGLYYGLRFAGSAVLIGLVVGAVRLTP